jgi:hypothetical protein
LLQSDAQDAFVHNLDQEQAAQPIWPYFVLAALLLLPFDVGIRRLVVTRRDLEKAREALVAPFRRTPVELSEAASARLGRLKDAKGRARPVSPDAEESSGPAEPAPLPPLPPAYSPQKTRSRARRSAPPPASKPAQPPQKPASAQQEASLASKLLEQRRRASQDRDKQE